MRLKYNKESTDALEFALLHDWGDEAYLENGQIHGLIKVINHELKKYEISKPINATMKEVRRFGGYEQMKNMEVKRYRSINVRLLRPTSHKKDYRIKICEDFYGEFVLINYYHDSICHHNVIEQAINFLSNHGFNVVGYSDLYSNYAYDHIVFIDDCVREGVRLKDL